MPLYMVYTKNMKKRQTCETIKKTREENKCMSALRTMFRYEDDIKRNFFWSVRRNNKFFHFSKEIMRCCNYRNYVTVILILKIQTWSLNAIGIWDKSPSTFIIAFWWHHRWSNLETLWLPICDVKGLHVIAACWTFAIQCRVLIYARLATL